LCRATVTITPNPSLESLDNAARIFLLALSFCHSLVSNLTRWFFSPFVFLYPLLSYLVSPLSHFVATIGNVLFLTPFCTTRYILTSIYPIYAFCGVACITGIVVGIGGRGLSALLTRAFAKTEQDGTVSAYVPTPTGDERRSRRRRVRVSGEYT
jgi:hypothetical protein